MVIDKLSDISPLRTLILKDTDINNYVFKQKRVEIDIREKYDLALVLGCSNHDIMQHRINAAVKLYQQKIVSKLFLTGGIGFMSRNRNSSEANIMQKYMLSQGVIDSDIIIEDKSRDTFENIKNSLNQIEKICGDEGKVIIVTSDFHSKRSKGILEKLTSLKIYSYGVLDGKHDFEVWNKSNFFAKKLIKMEAFLISWYTRRGIINDQKIVTINRNIDDKL